MNIRRTLLAASLIGLLSACNDGDTELSIDVGTDTETTDGGETSGDVAEDATADTGESDTGESDTGESDTGESDTGTPDADVDAPTCDDSECEALGRGACVDDACGDCLDELDPVEGTSLCCAFGERPNTAGDACLECPGEDDICSDRGRCVGGDSVATCECDDGFIGDACESLVVQPCDADPCGDGGTCTNMDDGFSCECDDGYEGDTCTVCETVLDLPDRCVAADFPDHRPCEGFIDGDIDGYGVQCLEGENNAFCTDGVIDNMDLMFAYDTPTTLSGVRMLGDWHAKRPNVWQVWRSDDEAVGPDNGAEFVSSGTANRSEWQCVTGEPCDDDVPSLCCLDGRDAPQRFPSGLHVAKYDNLRFSPRTSSVWWIRIVDTQQPSNLYVRSFEFEASACGVDDVCAEDPCFGDVECRPSTDGALCADCPIDMTGNGVDCAPCPVEIQTPASCSVAGFDDEICDRIIDGVLDSAGLIIDCNASETDPSHCTDGAVDTADIHFVFDEAEMIHQLRFASDWHSKRPDVYEIWASDSAAEGPGTGGTLVATVTAERTGTQCIEGDACTGEIPSWCCPDGRDAVQRLDGHQRATYDIAQFTPFEASHWWIRVVTSQGPRFVSFYGVDFMSPDCSAPHPCNNSCAPGVTCQPTPETYYCAE